ncbi:MAG: hypothetical protein ACREIP_02505 [Alphaproteobacteria bacterium]
MKRLILAAAALASVVALGACGNIPKDRGICPRVAILADAAKITAFRPGAPEIPENVMFTGEMTNIRINCKYNDRELVELEADVFVTMILRKGPAAQGDTAELPYFITVADRRGTVLSKRQFPLRINFGGNPAVEHIERSWQFFRLKRGYGGIEYETWAGFQLDERQLEFNRRAASR